MLRVRMEHENSIENRGGFDAVCWLRRDREGAERRGCDWREFDCGWRAGDSGFIGGDGRAVRLVSSGD